VFLRGLAAAEAAGDDGAAVDAAHVRALSVATEEAEHWVTLGSRRADA